MASLLLMPCGVESRSLEIEGLVNASCNLGVLETTNTHVKILAMARGAAEFYNRRIECQAAALAKQIGAEVVFIQRSPAWPYNPDSKLLKTAIEVYPSIFKREPIVTAIHAGLECGLFAEKIDGLDIIALGPNAYDLHTPDERLSISSTAHIWEFLQSLLKAL